MTDTSKMNKNSWRYRAWARTYRHSWQVPERTSLCPMFWRTVIFNAAMIVAWPFKATAKLVWTPVAASGRLVSDVTNPWHEQLVFVFAFSAIFGAGTGFGILGETFGWLFIAKQATGVAVLFAVVALAILAIIAICWLFEHVISPPVEWCFKQAFRPVVWAVKTFFTKYGPRMEAWFERKFNQAEPVVNHGAALIHGWKNKFCPTIEFVD